MSWRFRKSFKVIPGVRLNLTARGLSATFGAAPFSVNVGPRGVYRNTSIPGTGIWERHRIAGPPHGSPQPSLLGLTPSAVPLPRAISPSLGTEIHSASTELLTSESLAQLRRILTDAYTEREELTREVSKATYESKIAANRYHKWEHGVLLKRIFKQSLKARKEAAETAAAKLGELQEQLRLTTIATEITVDRAQAEPYYRLRDTFAILSESQKVWNVLTETAIDRVAERSNADTAVNRTPVQLSLNSCDLIRWEQKVPHLPNRTGGDMFIYPGFILYRASKQAFALIDSRDVTLRFVSTRFTETDPVPSDSQIVGRTWDKCNKDGSPDRRFRDNYQIPVVNYGTLLFGSRDGLDVRYICSNPALAQEFVKAWTAFQMSFDGGSPSLNTDGFGVHAANTLNMLLPAKQAFDRLTSACEIFRPAHQNLLDTIAAVSKQHHGEACKATFSEEEFAAYTAAVVELIAAAKEYEGASAAFVSTAARENFRRAIQDLETSWANFFSVIDCRINSHGLMPFLNAVNAFSQARAELFDIVAALLRKANRVGASV